MLLDPNKSGANFVSKDFINLSISAVLSVASVSKFSTGINLSPGINGSREVASCRPPCPFLSSAPPKTDTTFSPLPRIGNAGFLSL